MCPWQIPLAAATLLSLAPERAALAEKVKLSGTLATGYETDDEPEPEAEAEVRFKTRRTRGARAVFKLEARYFKSDVALEDAYIDYKGSERLRFQLGVNKKRLGLEYQQGRAERLTPERSLLYQRLEGLGIVGRQLNLRVLTELDSQASIELTAGTTGNRDANVLVHVAKQMGPLGVGTWGLLERRRIDRGYLTIWANAVSAWYISPRYRLVLELFAGIDPIETELERLVGDGRRVRFAGAKTEIAVRLPLRAGIDVEPLVQSSLVVLDTAAPEANALQLSGGANLRYGRAVLALIAGYRSEAERTPPHSRSLSGPHVHVQARFHF